MITFAVEQADGCALHRFEQASDADLDRLDPAIPLPAALVVAWHAGECPDGLQEMDAALARPCPAVASR